VVPTDDSSYSILAPSFAKWWGSDARALANAFRNSGHIIIDIDEEDYISWRWSSKPSKVLQRLFSSVWVNDFNQAVIRQAKTSVYDFILVYKGRLLKPETLKVLRSYGKPIYNFYPDVSFEDHGKNIPSVLPLYDCVFTTKIYHGDTQIKKFGIKHLEYVRHGFDPQVHRPIKLSADVYKKYTCDVSFVGCWSPEKEEKIFSLLRHYENLSLKVYGLGWKYASTELKQKLGENLKQGVFGDELATVYCASKINLGLLSRAFGDCSIGDQTTARTFQIPASMSFMLHEDTEGVRTLFNCDEEIILFKDNKDLIEKVKLALNNNDLRNEVKERAYKRCLKEPYDYSQAAGNIIDYYNRTKDK
jgi:spore maturation protein CgeB